MALQITLIKTPTKVSVSKTTQTFHKQGGTLGRGEANAWVLPDPDRYLSSCHCEVLFDSNQYYLLDLSTNGTFFNNSPEPLGKGAKSPLADGDIFEVGEYRFAVKLVDDQDFAGTSPFAAAKMPNDIFAGISPSGSPASGFAQPFAGGGFLPADYNIGIDSQGVDPIALWDAVQKPPSTPDFQRPGPGVNGPMFDPVSGAIVPHKPYSGTTADHTPSVDQAINWPNTAQENLIPENWDTMDLMSSPSPAQPFADAPPPWDRDIDFLNSPARGQQAPTQPSQPRPATVATTIPDYQRRIYPESTSSESAADTPPPASYPPSDYPQAQAFAPSPIATVAPARPAGAEAGTAVASQQAHFGQGAGGNRLIAAMGLDAQRLSPEQVDEISDMVGELMRETVAGLMQVLRSRTSIKNEFRMNLTTIQSAENNPLKFSVTVDDALENMFIKKSSAYKKPVDAFREGFQEIGEHQLAMIAGIRQGFDKMMQRFDPDNLENTFNKQGKGSLIPGMQKTKHWTSYCDHYAGFVDNMESSFQYLFGSDFVSAYEEQLRKLAAARKHNK